MKTAVTCSALMGLLLFALGLYVSTKRGRTQQIGTTPQNPADPLFKAIRAHGNTAEYVPMLAVLMLYLGDAIPCRVGAMAHGDRDRMSLSHRGRNHHVAHPG